MATTRKQISYGSQGDEVKELQTALNNNGYKLDTDGIFGAKTQAAVKAYQKANGLSVDGVVGNNTWGSLLGGSSSSNSSTTSSEATKTNPYTNVDLSKYDGGYKKSDTVLGAENKKTEAENAYANYGDFSYGKQSDYDAIWDQIQNREKFSYDLNGDALYQQYKDKYITQGKMAMQDTMGQAAAMTGGYGNSYAAAVGNQAYQASLQNLNDIVPELYQMAYDKYNQEGQDLYNKYAMLTDDRNTEYGMWGDKRNALLADREYYAGRADTEYSKGYGEWSDEYNRDFNQYWNETNFGYGQERDKVSDEQWQKSFEEGQRQYNETMKFNKEQASKSVSSGGYEFDVDDWIKIQSGIESAAASGKDALAEFLYGLVANGVISAEYSEQVIARYFPSDPPGVVDTTVDPLKKTLKGSGSPGGRLAFQQQVKN